MVRQRRGLLIRRFRVRAPGHPSQKSVVEPIPLLESAFAVLRDLRFFKVGAKVWIKVRFKPPVRGSP